MKQVKNIFYYVALTGIAFLFSCAEEGFEQATITFYPVLKYELTEPAPGGNGQSFTVRLRTSRSMTETSQVNVRIRGNGAGYGNSYTTNPPQLEPGIVTLTIPAGEKEASFTFTTKSDGLSELRDYSYTFEIVEASNKIKSIGQSTFEMTVIDSNPPFVDYNFEDCNTTPVGPVERIVEGDNVMQTTVWGCTTFGYPAQPSRAAQANAFGRGSGVSNSYLVFPVIDGTQYDNVLVKFWVQSFFTGQGTSQVVFSTNYSGTGNPEAEGVTWTPLTELNAKLPAVGSREWKLVDGIISNIGDDPLYIAIQYKGGTSASASSWAFDNFTLKGN